MMGVVEPIVTNLRIRNMTYATSCDVVLGRKSWRTSAGDAVSRVIGEASLHVETPHYQQHASSCATFIRSRPSRGRRAIKMGCYKLIHNDLRPHVRSRHHCSGPCSCTTNILSNDNAMHGTSMARVADHATNNINIILRQRSCLAHSQAIVPSGSSRCAPTLQRWCSQGMTVKRRRLQAAEQQLPFGLHRSSDARKT
jgi:hypothetical protein